MKKHLLLAALCAASFVHASSHATHWGYTGHSAPEYWGDLDPKFEMCKKGLSQSPINITKTVTVTTTGLTPIDFNYHAESIDVVNNGHAIQVNVDQHSSINIDGKHFVLKQFHFHAPSENEIEGRSFPLEAHFVHATKNGELAVIAVLFELGDANPTLQKIFNAMPEKAGEKKALKLDEKMIDLLLPQSKEYYYFSGSLTTPPCSEGVRWMLLKKYVTLSKEQLKTFRAVIHDNNRLTMPLNARKVLK